MTRWRGGEHELEVEESELDSFDIGLPHGGVVAAGWF